MRKSTKIVSFLLVFVMLLSSLLFTSCKKPTVSTGISMNTPIYSNDTPNENVEGASYGAGGLLFMPLENDTYGVAAGNAKYQTKITIPETFNGKPVTAIFEGAFSGASNLRNISIPNSITFVGDGAFDDCENLEYYEDAYAFYLGNAKNKYLILIEAKDPTMTSCSLSENTVAICDRAFENCYNLTKLNTPSVTSIGSYAFSGCSALTAITIPKTATSIGEETFYGCSSLKKITIPASVSVIGDSAFSGCKDLQEVTFEGNSALTKINNGAFYNCSSLSKISIPKNVLYIGDQKANASSVSNTYGAFEGCKALTTVKFECSNLKMIGNKAFQGCSKLTTAVLPDTLPEIGTSAFQGCSALTTIKIPSAVTKIKPSTFEGCSALKTVTLNDYILIISDKAFSGCSSLTTITIPANVTIIGKGAFASCKLTSVTMKNTEKWSSVDALGKKTAIDPKVLATASSAADYIVNNNDGFFQRG